VTILEFIGAFWLLALTALVLWVGFHRRMARKVDMLQAAARAEDWQREELERIHALRPTEPEWRSPARLMGFPESESDMERDRR
jgi:hypothetical protein